MLQQLQRAHIASPRMPRASSVGNSSLWRRDNHPHQPCLSDLCLCALACREPSGCVHRAWCHLFVCLHDSIAWNSPVIPDRQKRLSPESHLRPWISRLRTLFVPASVQNTTDQVTSCGARLLSLHCCRVAFHFLLIGYFSSAHCTVFLFYFACTLVFHYFIVSVIYTV